MDEKNGIDKFLTKNRVKFKYDKRSGFYILTNYYTDRNYYYHLRDRIWYAEGNLTRYRACDFTSFYFAHFARGKYGPLGKKIKTWLKGGDKMN